MFFIGRPVELERARIPAVAHLSGGAGIRLSQKSHRLSRLGRSPSDSPLNPGVRSLAGEPKSHLAAALSCKVQAAGGNCSIDVATGFAGVAALYWCHVALALQHPRDRTPHLEHFVSRLNRFLDSSLGRSLIHHAGWV